MQESQNYKLKLPEGFDNVKRQDFVDNFNIIDKTMKDNADNISQLSNPNLLMNSYFIKPINQRDSTTYNEWGKYAIDRWINRAKSVVVQSDGILITMASQYHSIAQIFEDISIFKNKTVTLSGELEVIKGSVYSDLNSTDSKGQGKINCYKSFDVGNHSFSVTSTLSNDISKLTLAIVNRIEGESKVKIKWLKLELGSKPTQFIPRSYGEELALCKRYYQSLNPSKAPYQHYGYGMNVVDSLKVLFRTYLTVPMRISPTISFIGNIKIDEGDTIKSISLDTYSVGSNVIKFAVSRDSTVLAGIHYLEGAGGSNISDIMLDAELY